MLAVRSRASGRWVLFAIAATAMAVIVAGSGSAFTQSDVLTALADQQSGRILNVRTFGASGNLRTVDVTVTGGSTSAIVRGDVADFIVGQAVTILRAGRPPTVSTPTGLSGSAISYDKSGRMGQPCRVDAGNARCDARWTWRIIAVDSQHGSSAPSAPFSVDSAPATPNPANRIHLIWNSDAAAVSYLVYGCQGDGCTPKLRAVLPNNWHTSKAGLGCGGCTRPEFMIYDYMGHDFGTDEFSGKSMPPGPRNQSFYARIRSISGRNIVLSAPTAVTASTKMIHDDAPAFQAAIDRLRSVGGVLATGGLILIPPGEYPIGETLDFYLASGVRLAGLGSASSTQLVWHGGAGGIVMSLNQARDCILENFTLTSFYGSTPGVFIDIDRYDQGQGIKSPASHDTLHSISLERAGVAIRLGNRSNENGELMEFRDVVIGAGPNGEGGWYGYYIAGGGESYDERIDGGTVALRDVGVYLNRAGSVDSYVLNLSHNLIDWYVNDFVSSHVVEIGSDSEMAAHHLFVSFSHPHGIHFVIASSRLVTSGRAIASDGYYVVDNASLGLQLVGDLITQQVGTPCKVMFSNGDQSPAPLLSSQNFYGDPRPFATPPGIRPALLSVMDTGMVPHAPAISGVVEPAVANLIASMMHAATSPVPIGSARMKRVSP
jgi:hypothetical protein